MKKILATGICTLITAVSAPAWASGILAARFGGELGHPTTSNPTAIFYNPAGLALESGTRIYADGTFAYRHASYDRPADAISRIGPNVFGFTPEDGIAANSGKGELNNFIASPFVAAVSDFGIRNFALGAAFYVPYGGTAKWGLRKDFEGTEAGAKFPGGVDGPQRWFTEDGKIQSLFITGAAAYRLRHPRLSFGLGVSAVNNVLHTVRARNLDGSDDLVNGDGSLKEGRSLVHASSWTVAVNAGVIWQPWRRVWLGASYLSQPGFGENTLDGTLTTGFLGFASDQKIKLKQSMPDIWRLGGRWRPSDDVELRLFGEYVRWSRFKRQCFLAADVDDANCDLNPDGSEGPNARGVVQNIPREWRDAFGVRVGGSYWLSPPIEVFVGGGYDSNAIPNKTMDPSLYDMHKLTAALGARFEIGKNIALAGTFTQVFYFTRDVPVAESQPFEGATKQPNSGGTYKQLISVLDVNAQYRF
ncbi:OmpP1/FadL family transporter [Vulgatibacter incomptus]|uniref:Long-chain fatty acid transport protein n=1 Tax=Vulgatibacter incomptus TaxID=1391653 RepID=A0A0K1PFT7_9BACT|nr:outer membrane protein transport protein [Vulgatibacter incomptus]AKU92398.1 Long-chain fatty acid transport protein [Vulgatibacter incomptus]